MKISFSLVLVLITAGTGGWQQTVDAAAVDAVTPMRKQQLTQHPRVQVDGGRRAHLYGYRFTPLKDGRITHLGGRFKGSKTVVLIDNEKQRVIGRANVKATRGGWTYEPLGRGSVKVTAGRLYSVAARMGAHNSGSMIRGVDFPFRQGQVLVLGGQQGVSARASDRNWILKLKSNDSGLVKGLVDVRFVTAGGAGSSSGSSSGGGSGSSGSSSSGSSGGSSSGGRISYEQRGDRLFVSSTKAPTWKVEFAIGSGAPGGGTAIGLYVPATSSNSVVERAPFRNCCSGLGLDNLEWRHRPFGGGSGTRAALGYTAQVGSVRYLERSNRRLVFELTGSWTGVSRFTRRTTVTPDGFSTALSAAYSGTTGMDSMWWLIAMFHDRSLDSGRVTIQDGDTGPVTLRKTTVGTPLPSGISMPYTINYPLAGKNHTVSMTMNTLADGSGAGRFYEYFDRGNVHNIPIGPYYLIYPRWTSVFARRTYDFRYSWKLSR